MKGNKNMYKFDAKKTKEELIRWINDWFELNGKGCNAVIGISGGKDSSIVAALCVEALGKDRVIGVLMPNGVQNDIDYAFKAVKYLDIKYLDFDISQVNTCILDKLDDKNIEVSEQTKINLPPRIRMTVLYAISQSMNGRVANTCNLSEDYVGYATRYGDSAGDFSPLSDLTVTEVLQIGDELGLPKELVYKTPSDGLCGKTDEDNLGFTYAILDRYIRTGETEDKEIKEKIDEMHEKNKFKLDLMPKFEYKMEK